MSLTNTIRGLFKSPMDATPPGFDDVCAAEERVRPLARVTPFLRFEALDEAAGATVFVKCENVQRTGSFKIRGATNRIARLGTEERMRGVVAFSSGNHAQGVAAAAKAFGAPATIVMPEDSPKVKMEGVRRLGGEIVTYDRETESREEISAQIAAETGATLVPSFDDPDVISGQGTAGLEIARQALDAGGPLDALIVCAGGGGLTAGIALALEGLSPATKIYTAEPEGFDDHMKSFDAGKIVENERRGGSICDALLSPAPGNITFAINRKRVAGGFAISDDEALDAMAFAFRRMKLVVEPGGAAALAALLSRKPFARRSRVGVVLTGGNVDSDIYQRALARL